MSSVSTSDTVHQSELRIRLPEFPSTGNVEVDVYHSSKHQCDQDPCAERRLHLGSVRSKPSDLASHSSWKVFNITELLKFWLHQGEMVPIEEHTQMSAAETKADEEEGVQHPTANRVMMVVYSKQNQAKTSTLIQTAEASGGPQIVKPHLIHHRVL